MNFMNLLKTCSFTKFERVAVGGTLTELRFAHCINDLYSIKARDLLAKSDANKRCSVRQVLNQRCIVIISTSFGVRPRPNANHSPVPHLIIENLLELL